ncbi:MAG TPA: PPC domain-containing protein [Kofleriaceae bacterium]
MRRALVGLVLIAGCGDNAPDKTAMCKLGTAKSAATIQDRKIIGAVAPYAADLSLAARDEQLRVSIAARRQVAWEAVAKVLAPTPLGEPMLAANFGGQPSIPAWHTWFARDDFDRVFKKLYRDLGPAARAVRATLDAATIDAGFAWNTQALNELPVEWPEQRYLDYLAVIDTQEEAQGIGGVNRVGYSSGAMRQLIHSYAQQYACRVDAPPDPFAPQPVREGSMVKQVEHVAVTECEWHVLGPFMTADGAKVTVTSTGDGDADVYVRRGVAPEPQDFDCRSSGDASSESCSVAGGGPIYVAVFGAKASTVEVDVEYLSQDVAAPTCLDGEMPRDAVLVKADWRRKLTGENLPYFDTSAARMRERLGLKADWATGDGSVNPDSSSIYTITLPNGNEFRMPALHVMTKELDHWLWITLWWSKDPDTDFGADRPAAVAALPGPWRNYKMCVTTAYLEGDPDPRGGAGGSLGDALEAVHGGVGTPSWCSNPYLELGEGNAATNCIGCHQHGGTALTPEMILASEPHHGTTRVRNNFFTDYLWAIKGGQGEDLSALVQAEVDYWDANDP